MGSVRTIADRLRGVIVAMPTPMEASGAIDLAATAHLVDWLVGGGVDGIFICGTTGEGPLLDDTERVAMTRAAVGVAAGRVPIVAQVGAATTAQTVALAQRCADTGADALAVITPYYFRYREDELIAHYTAVGAAIPNHPVLAYNIPALTGNALTPSVVRGLRDLPNLVGMKDSTGDEYGLLQLAEAGGPAFRLIVGADLLSLEVLAMGWAGIVSGPAAAIPEPYVALWRVASAEGAAASGNANDWPAIAAAYRQVAAACHVLRNGADIPRIKAALHLRGVIEPHVRAPLRALPERDMPDLAAAVKALLSSLASGGSEYSSKGRGGGEGSPGRSGRPGS